MRLRIEIECDNAAFDRVPEVEISRILTYTINMINNGTKDAILHDANGFPVGRVRFDEA